MPRHRHHQPPERAPKNRACGATGTGLRRCAAPVPVMKSFFLNARFYVSSLLMVIIFSGHLRLAAN
ncbi:hypothetical protein AHV57_22225 [Salmonella enterica]|nr:hypothetical protein [Salmonella enterica]